MKKKQVPSPDWAIEARIAMLRQGEMSVTELAKELGVNRTQVSGVLNGTLVSEAIKEKIITYLGIQL